MNKIKLYDLFWAPIYDFLANNTPLVGYRQTKQRAVEELNLHRGQSVLVYCVGTGFELKYIVEKIGPKGTIAAIDSSREMLRRARDKINKFGWKNVQLIQADVTKYEQQQQFDASLCCFGLSTILQSEEALYGLIQHTKSGGRIAIADAMPLFGPRRIFNPFRIIVSQLLGTGQAGLEKAKLHKQILESRLTNITYETYNGNYIMAGTKPQTDQSSSLTT